MAAGEAAPVDAAGQDAAAQDTGHSCMYICMYVPQSELASVGVLAEFDRGLGRVGHRFRLRDVTPIDVTPIENTGKLVVFDVTPIETQQN